MDRRQRIDLEVRTILVTWRSLMRGVRHGDVPNPSKSMRGATARALAQLRHVEDKLSDGAPGDGRYLATVLAAARAELHCAIGHEVGQSGESAG
jgi:hypothetical protein